MLLKLSPTQCVISVTNIICRQHRCFRLRLVRSFETNYLESLFMRLSKTIFFAWFFEFFAIHSCSLKKFLSTNRNFSYKYHRKLNIKPKASQKDMKFAEATREFQSAIVISFWDALDFKEDSILTVFEIRWRIGHHIYHRKRSIQKQRSGTLFQTEKNKN